MFIFDVHFGIFIQCLVAGVQKWCLLMGLAYLHL
jgi:hypothetical protein